MAQRPPRPRRRLVVAVHDVAPASWLRLRPLLLELDRLGVRPRVLKVIPKDLAADPELIAVLQAEQAAGSEVVMHGYSHAVDGPLRGPWIRRLRARLSAPHDAEFLSLSDDAVARRLALGHAIVEDAGLRADGFCAPGWLEPPGLRPALRAAGFRYDVRMLSVVDVRSGRMVRTAWIGYMGAGPAQERLVGVANALTRRALATAAVLKVFLHPTKAGGEPACRRVLDILPRLMEDRQIVTYGQLVEP